VIALEQLDRACGDGLRFGWVTADTWYTEKPEFVRGLEQRGHRFVLETPRNFRLWLHDPAHGPATPPKPVENLLPFSRALMRQPWQKYHIKDTDKGAMVWEVKYAPCWLPRAGGVVGPYWLIVVRNVLDPDEVKFFISNASPGVPLPVILHVAFGRWPVERCLEDEKSELGLSHFEVRCYPALKRHLLVTQVSHLFLARQTTRLRGGKSGDHFAASSSRRQRIDPVVFFVGRRSPCLAGAGGTPADLLPAPQRNRPPMSHQKPPRSPAETQDRPYENPKLSPWLNVQGAL
jgi:hypothetical protein